MLIFLYSCAAVDKVSADLKKERRVVPEPLVLYHSLLFIILTVH